MTLSVALPSHETCNARGLGGPDLVDLGSSLATTLHPKSVKCFVVHNTGGRYRRSLQFSRII